MVFLSSFFLSFFLSFFRSFFLFRFVSFILLEYVVLTPISFIVNAHAAISTASTRRNRDADSINARAGRRRMIMMSMSRVRFLLIRVGSLPTRTTLMLMLMLVGLLPPPLLASSSATLLFITRGWWICFTTRFNDYVFFLVLIFLVLGLFCFLFLPASSLLLVLSPAFFFSLIWNLCTGLTVSVFLSLSPLSVLGYLFLFTRISISLVLSAAACYPSPQSPKSF